MQKIKKYIIGIIALILVMFGFYTQKPDNTVPQDSGIEILYTFRYPEQLEKHYEKHGIAMGYDSPEAYLEGANRVVASKDALHKLEAEDGDDVYYLEDTNEFVIVSKKGYIRTYFNPNDGIEYFNRQ